MRTIKFTLNARLDADTNVSISTEVIVDEEHENLVEVGKEAGTSMLQFFTGAVKSFGEDDDEPA